METISKSYTYQDLIEAVNKRKTRDSFVLIDKKDYFEWIVDLFVARLNNSVAVLCDYIPTENDLLLQPEIIFSTSGTHLKKTVMHRESSIFHNTYAGIKALDLCGVGISYSIVPLNHIFGFECGLLVPLILGWKITYSLDPISCCSDLELFKPTFIIALPGTSSLFPSSFQGLALFGGAPILNADIESARSKGYEIRAGYGATECLSVCVGIPSGTSYGPPLEGKEV